MIERFLRIPRETRVGQFTGNLLIGGGCNSRNVIEGSGKKKYISGFRTPLLRLLFQFHPIPVCHTQNVAFSFVRWKRLVVGWTQIVRAKIRFTKLKKHYRKGRKKCNVREKSTYCNGQLELKVWNWVAISFA